MRIDQFLKKTYLSKQRGTAKELCDHRFIKINGQFCKPSKQVRMGDVIEMETVSGMKQYVVLAIPGGNVKKSESVLYYREKGG
ncbi:RNA-binding S4 domain-containing protein [candidate division WOR-3 bacterium]|nr:RNA-binding S4 domain-containing protein [candidate division WOR-3 bacterium]